MRCSGARPGERTHAERRHRGSRTSSARSEQHGRRDVHGLPQRRCYNALSDVTFVVMSLLMFRVAHPAAQLDLRRTTDGARERAPNPVDELIASRAVARGKENTVSTFDDL